MDLKTSPKKIEGFFFNKGGLTRIHSQPAMPLLSQLRQDTPVVVCPVVGAASQLLSAFQCFCPRSLTHNVSGTSHNSKSMYRVVLSFAAQLCGTPCIRRALFPPKSGTSKGSSIQTPQTDNQGYKVQNVHLVLVSVSTASQCTRPCTVLQHVLHSRPCAGNRCHGSTGWLTVGMCVYRSICI